MRRKPLSGKMVRIRRRANKKREAIWVEIPIEHYENIKKRRKTLAAIEPVKEVASVAPKPVTELDTLESLLNSMGYKRG